MIRKAYEVIADTLRDQIIQGEWAVGSRLPSVEQLAVLHGVGRSTIREALMSLKAHGWVDVKHGGGTFVLKKHDTLHIAAPEIGNVQQLKQWLELRYILETESAAMAAVRKSEEQLQVMKGILEMTAEHEEEALEASDVRFHLAVANASGNALLERMLESLFLTMGPAIRESRRLWLFAEQSEAARLSEEHLAIVEAISVGDAALAKTRMAAHLRKVEQVLDKLQL
ncbi:FadR/GntR family transcriptional regulator [Paenibacillus cremeus]|uniref:FadR family transcriptional regulator n=1 Tax=Paenibacillus cremeus TaxID=2163881 RepID=A0A559K8L2_9BACL|nr:FadR/GntR family transcriptional regulator [Paenibacillus cremeus]TVY08458.1 FadR family transcriptional regulator [Paenibacillus cremeus]